MKIVQTVTLISTGHFPESEHWKNTKDYLTAMIKAIEHPVGSGSFTIKPEKGKKRGEGNGVTLIKTSLIEKLRNNNWKIEKPLNIAVGKKPGKVDAVLENPEGTIVVEWETGNISSSHRALNKMCVGLMGGIIKGGILIVPSRNLYQFLTDRVGNISELEPYFVLWENVPCEEGILEIIVIEHDATSDDVPRLKKGTDGRALA